MKLSIQEVADCLELPISTVERWVRQGRIPTQKSGTTIIFESAILEKWAKDYNLRFAFPDQRICEAVECQDETLLSAMNRGGVAFEVSGESIDEILESAVNHIPNLSDDQKVMLLQRLIEREALASTGVGKGVAIPHPRVPLPNLSADPIITTCFLKTPMDFKAVDDKPVFVLFLLLCPSVKVHLQLLSRLAYCVRDGIFTDFLKSCLESTELFSRISEFEKHFDKADPSS